MLLEYIITPSLKIEQLYTMQKKQIGEQDYRALSSLFFFLQYGSAFFRISFDPVFFVYSFIATFM